MGMGVTLEAIDAVRERTGVSYRRAYEALTDAGGDVVQAILALEADSSPWLSSRGQGLKSGLRRLVAHGNATKVVVRSRSGQTLVEVPATLAAAGSLIFPLAAVAGVAAALAGHASLAIER